MRKVSLKMNELLKYKVIKRVHDGDISKTRASVELGVSKRTVNRLLIKYREKGKAGFVHGNTNRQPSNSLPQELVNQIVHLYQTDYQHFNFSHFTEMLQDHHDIFVSRTSVTRCLNHAGIYSPKERLMTRKNRKKAELRMDMPSASQQEIEASVNHILHIEDAHPRKARAKYFGEEIQMDASIHLWFGRKKTALHLAIDNCTGIIVGGYFAQQETLNGYYHVFEQILKNHGIPFKFLTDNRTVFNYMSLNKKTDDKDVLTQFGYACKQLGVTIETSSVSQYKGQIERANGTFQDRLVNELRLHHICTMEEANEYLIHRFIPNFNRCFALPKESFGSIMEKSPTDEKINVTLAVLSERKFDNGNSIKYHSKMYQPYDEHGNLVCVKPHTGCLVIRALDGSLFVTIDNSIFCLEEFVPHKQHSEEFDIPFESRKERKVYIPPMNHPWRRSAFSTHRRKAHEAHQYA